MTQPKHRQTLLKRNNVAQIMLGVWRHRPVSRAELAKITGLSKRCVFDLVDELVASGQLIETGMVSGSRGRPRMVVDINPNEAPVAGVYVMPRVAEIVVANSAGEFLTRRTIPLDSRKSTVEEFVGSIVAGIERCVEAAKTDIPSLAGVGLAVSSMTNQVLGTVEGWEPLTGWNGLPLVKLISQALHIPVYLDNDVRAAAITHEWFNSNSHGDAAYISVCDGIGFAFAQPQGVLRGTHGMAGQLEHISIDSDGPMCKCGHRGCLRVVGTDTAFVRQLWPELPEDFLDVPIVERADLMQRGLDLAMSGDEKALSALTGVLKNFAQGVAVVINMFDPRVVYLFGNLIDPAPDLIVDAIRQEALQHVMMQVRGVEIKTIPNWMEFSLRGSIGLVLGRQFRDLHDDNLNARTVSNW